MNKAELIRHEIEKRRVHNLAIGNPLFSAMAEEDIELLCFIDSLQEEPVSEELEEAIDTYLKSYWGGEKEKQEWPFLKKMAIYFAQWQKQKDSISVSDDLEEEIDNYIKRNGYDGLDSIEEVKYIAQYFTKWQKLQDMGITNKAQDVVADVLSSADNPLDAYATEMAFMMLPATLKESYHQTNRDRICDAVRLGAKWQKEHLLKPSDGEDLPEYEREVVVFTQNFPNDAGIMMVAIAHRPDPKGWDGKSITTGKIEHYTPKTYGKGGWNIPDVIFWLDVELPKEIEL